MSDAPRFERLSKGDKFAVDPDSIERELASLWREAGKATEQGRQPVTRACLWNVVVHREQRPGQEGHAAADKLQDALRELPKHVASRALILETHAERDGPDLDSWISANCALSADGSKMVCSEEITVAAYGDGARHLTSLVNALLVPDVPTAAVFASVPSKRIGHELIQVADRIVTNANTAISSNPLLRVRALDGETRLGSMDVAWLSQSGLRSLVAEMFEPPASESAWRSIEDVCIRTTPGQIASAKLLLGWISATLGGGKPDDVGANAWQVSSNLRISVEIDEQSSDDAVSEIAMISPQGTSFVKQIEGRVWQISPQGLPSRQTVIENTSAAEHLAGALRSRAEDRVYATALHVASQL